MLQAIQERRLIEIALAYFKKQGLILYMRNDVSLHSTLHLFWLQVQRIAARGLIIDGKTARNDLVEQLGVTPDEANWLFEESRN